MTEINQETIKGTSIEALTAPSIERRVRELIPGSEISVVLLRDVGANLHSHTYRAIQIALGEQPVLKLPAFRPEVQGQRVVSATRHGDYALFVRGRPPVACHLEQVLDRPACVWRALLGDDRIALTQFIGCRSDKNLVTSATRVLAASQCLKKIGLVVSAQLFFLSSSDDGWVLLSSGRLVIGTYAAQIGREGSKMVVAILARQDHAKN